MTNKLINNVNITVQDNLCIGCGMCKLSCNYNAIKIDFNKNKEYNPIINENCTECGLCYRVCPMSVENLNSRINAAASKGTIYGLEKSVGIFKGHELNYDNYIKSSSGGILSALLKYLLDNNIIDTVIHAEQLYGNNDDKLFKASISKNSKEIDDKRSSFYYPIEFSDVLESVKNDNSCEKIAFLGIPCVLSGLKNLRKHDKIIDEKIRFSFALICSHNTSAQFTNCLVDSFDLKKNEKIKFKHRDKTGIQNAANYNNSITFKNNEIIDKSRNKTPYTLNWRSYSYSLNGCMYCPDFWGKDADAGFKDAWSFNLDRKEGETVFYVNNNELFSIVNQLQEKNIILKSDVSTEQLIKSQKDTLIHKTTYIESKQKRHKALRKAKKSKQIIKYSLIEKFFLFFDYNLKKRKIKSSKFLYRNFKLRIPQFMLKLPAFFIRKISVYLSILSLIKEQQYPFEVIYTAGYGYKNIGDEAQLSSNLAIWKEIAPKAKLTLLSPNPDYTRETHGNYEVIKATRNTFWGYHGIEYAGIGNTKFFKYLFKYKLLGLRLNAFFIKHFSTSFFISPESSYLLKKLKTAKVLHIGGGGFLTGKTASRLYDNMGLIRLANYFDTDIILSGHNIGIWQNKSQKRIAKQLKKAKLIGLRDNENSIKGLKEVGVFAKEKVFAFFDDALFCEPASKNELASYFNQNQISIDEKYILVNAYFFKNTETIVKETLEKLAIQLNEINKQKKYNIVLLSMHSSDLPALQFLESKLTSTAKIFSHDDNFRIVISLIQNAELTITMRHHPIIFSMAGGVPTLSIVFDDYFKHKNIGAMKLFDQEKYVHLYKDLFDETFKQQLIKVINERNNISKIIEQHVDQYRSQKGYIIKKYLSENAKDFIN
jgi:coenzyme F420-reducing hydrogenase beta subunit/polysaccharide pyruvyl transferase WcaK-like protein